MKAPRQKRFKKFSYTKRRRDSFRTEEWRVMCCSYLPSRNPFSRLGPGALTDSETKTPQPRCSARPLPLLLKGQQPGGEGRGASSSYRGLLIIRRTYTRKNLQGNPNTSIKLQWLSRPFKDPSWTQRTSKAGSIRVRSSDFLLSKSRNNYST